MAVEWLPGKNGFLLCKVDGNFKRCVVCDEPLEYTERHLCHHTCNPARIRRSDVVMKNGRDQVYLRSRGHGLSYSERILDGFFVSRKAGGSEREVERTADVSKAKT